VLVACRISAPRIEARAPDLAGPRLISASRPPVACRLAAESVRNHRAGKLAGAGIGHDHPPPIGITPLKENVTPFSVWVYTAVS
jgi:hypothetical protein